MIRSATTASEEKMIRGKSIQQARFHTMDFALGLGRERLEQQRRTGAITIAVRFFLQ